MPQPQTRVQPKAPEAAKTPAAPVKPNGFQVYDNESVETEAWGRILLLGPAKAGKSTSCALTSPPPVLVLNCDNEKSALIGPVNLGAKFKAINITTVRVWNQAIAYALEEAKAERVSTIVVDPISSLGETIVEELGRSMEGYDLWGRVKEELVGGIKDLMKADAHLIVTAHVLPNDDGLVGVLPAIPGKASTLIPAKLSDWVWLNLDTSKNPPERGFFVGPQKGWNHGCRNAKGSKIIDANITTLLEELGMRP